MAIKPNYQKDADNVVAVQTSKDPIEQQILAAGNLSEAQVEAIRGFQRRKGLTFGEAAIALGLVRRDSLFLALSKRYNYPVLNFGVDEGRFSRELVVGYQPFSTAAEAFRSVRSALATGPLSQGKNAFAVIGPHRAGRGHVFRRQSRVVFRPDGCSHSPCRCKLEEAEARRAVWRGSEDGGPGRGLDPWRGRIAARHYRHRPRLVAARRRRDRAPPAGIAELQGIFDAVAECAAQLWRGDLRHPRGVGERGRLRCRVPRRRGDGRGSAAPNEGERHQPRSRERWRASSATSRARFSSRF